MDPPPPSSVPPTSHPPPPPTSHPPPIATITNLGPIPQIPEDHPLRQQSTSSLLENYAPGPSVGNIDVGELLSALDGKWYSEETREMITAHKGMEAGFAFPDLPNNVQWGAIAALMKSNDAFLTERRELLEDEITVAESSSVVIGGKKRIINIEPKSLYTSLAEVVKDVECLVVISVVDHRNIIGQRQLAKVQKVVLHAFAGSAVDGGTIGTSGIQANLGASSRPNP
nr:hypothetical protein Iba_chr11dCG13040 [Ipomoea batatas]